MKKIKEPKEEKNPRKTRRSKSGASQVTITDPVNNGLKKRFRVKNVNYVSDNGIIQNGWLVSSLDGIDDAVELIQAQKAPVYILGEQASAFIKWSVSRSRTLRGELWKNQKKVEDFEFIADDIDFDVVKRYVADWCKQVGLK